MTMKILISSSTTPGCRAIQETSGVSAPLDLAVETKICARPYRFIPLRGGQLRQGASGFFQTSLTVLAVVLFLAAAGVVRAQSGIGDIVYTVGTVVRDSNGQNWAYLLWQGTQPGLVSNRTFAVYSKFGDPTNNTPYVRRSVVSLQTDARVIEPLLERAANLGDDPHKLVSDLTALFGNFIPPTAISRGDQLSAVMRGSMTDPRYYQNLLLLARNHAGINLALGFADAELIGLGRTTFEVRAFDPVASQDLAVIGRVTVEAGNPTVLPRPGPPVLVPDTSPKGDLNLTFRWGTPDNLRRLGLMQFGYNLYRVASGYAASHGWTVINPPPLPTLAGLVATNPAAAKRVNPVPITPGKLFSIAEAANFSPVTGDTNTFFIRDDDGRGRTNYINYGFTNGAQFIYYVSARDVLGRDGLVSTGLVATVCDRMPPYPPTHINVLNDYSYDPASKTSNQVLRVVWRQNQQTNESVALYYLYRWTNIVQMNALQGNPANNLIGVVSHIPGVTNASFIDNGAGSPSSLGAYGETYWYTVRAADVGACGPNFSPPGGPAYGVLRDRQGPPAGTGYVEINCVRPVVTALPVTYGTLRTADPINYNLYISCTRNDSRIEWAEFYCQAIYQADIAGPAGTIVVTNYFGQLNYGGASDVSTWWTPIQNPFTNAKPVKITIQVSCRAGLANGKISNFASTLVVPPSSSQQYAKVPFQATADSQRVIAGDRQNRDCIEHDPGGTNDIAITIIPTEGTAEYRLYRRVDGGPLSLLCQGPVTNLAQFIKCYESAHPVNGGTLCFFLQLLDASGNPSPLVPLGSCVDTAPNAPLPTPVLSRITSSGDSTTPQMNLSWFCPPYGVERFEVRIAADPTPPNTNQYALSASLSSTGAPPVSVTFTNSGTNLARDFNLFNTPMVGPAFGNDGALFQIRCKIEMGKTYYVTVRAHGKKGNYGKFSNYESFVWIPTNTPGPQVPWPQRPLPPAATTFFAAAYYLSPTNAFMPLQTASYTGNGVLVGYATFSHRITVTTKEGSPRIGTVLDPLSLIETNVNGGSLFPCAMYRYTVSNAGGAPPSGDTIQVSPLMENIAYQLSGSASQSTNTIILDPFIAVTSSTDATFNYIYFWLKDNQPVISGSRYKYILVHFGANPNHEVDQLVPSNEVNVP